MCPKLGCLYTIGEPLNNDWCFREERRIKNINKLPTWCTLPEYKEGNNEKNDKGNHSQL